LLNFAGGYQLLGWKLCDFAEDLEVIFALQHVYCFGIGRGSANLDLG
jgi:hypothetical protein